MEVEAADRSEIFESIASRRHLTAVISWSMHSVASAERGSAGGVAEQGGIFGDAMGLGSAIASENSSWWECLLDDLPVGIVAQKGGFWGTSECHLADEESMRQREIRRRLLRGKDPELRGYGRVWPTSPWPRAIRSSGPSYVTHLPSEGETEAAAHHVAEGRGALSTPLPLVDDQRVEELPPSIQ
ncbi:hypothetical protein NDU88_008139 [Pleurodeles waltl]|uniref:Uncharacterized protein n=1 Tax=Pleurodeles waltl TaxID=8319 RepID=A0AAV7N8V2_PLEWA|nr:hypothetical protein NDU88_008139 [Pleurodeles waltl]